MCSCETAGCPISTKKMREQEKYFARDSEETRLAGSTEQSRASRVFRPLCEFSPKLPLGLCSFGD